MATTYKRFEIVDYLKGYSIFTIVLFHLLQGVPLPKIFQLAINFGGAGVHVFVLCSGFGLYLSHLRKPLPYVQFLKKRFARVYIPYIIIIWISFLIPWMYHGSDRFIALLSHVFLFKMFVEQYTSSFGGQLWFISMIIQLYLLFPIIIYVFAKGSLLKNFLIALGISLIWSILVFLFGKSEVRIYNSFFLQYLWQFVLGMELAKYIIKHKDIKLPSRTVLLGVTVIGVLIAGIMGSQGGWMKLFNDIPSLVGYMSFALLIYGLKINQVNHFFLYTNGISYEWYLVHMLTFITLITFSTNVSFAKIAPLAFILSYLIGIIFRFLLQKTLYKWI